MEQAKEGVVAPGWLSSRKGKFSEGFRRRLGEAAPAGAVLVETGQGPGRLRHPPGSPAVPR